MQTWIPVIRQLLQRGIKVMGYFNNHYAGFAPGSIELFHQVWERMRESPPEQINASPGNNHSGEG
jgi:uncharacterized protein YecE (DUF72 family)